MFIHKSFKSSLRPNPFGTRWMASLLTVAVVGWTPSPSVAGGAGAPFSLRDFARSAPTLRSQHPVRTLQENAHLLEKMGGIVFESAARPDAEAEGKQVGIEYLPHNEDGKRLRISIGDRDHFPAIFDWQLLPIARFADSKATAVISTTEQSPDKIRYHPAFKNNLLGLRLFQADTLFDAPSSAWNLPRYYLPGDHTHWVTADRVHVRSLPNEKGSVVRVLKKWAGVKVLQSQLGWSRIELGKKSGWITSNLLTRKSPPLLGGGESGFHTEKPKALVEQIEAIRKRHHLSLRAKYGRDYRYGYLIHDKDSGIEFQSEPGRFTLTGQPEYYFWSGRKGEGKTHPVVHMNFEMRQKIQLIGQVNPVVFQALLNTMRYAAFFRYCKNKNPRQWKSFLKSLEPVKIPSIEIPVTSIFHGNRYQPGSG